MNDITDKEFSLIKNHIRDNYGISLGDEKKSLVFARLRSVLQKLNVDNFTQYYELLTHDTTGQMAITFIDKMTTNHTYFMREVDHFNYFRDTVLPYIEESAKEKDLRLWCAGCSSGEEPYTLQMIIQDYFGSKTSQWDINILATDISTQVLQQAKRGIYSADHVKTVPDNWKKSYFRKIDDDNYAVDDKIKSKILFRKFNLMEDKFPFKKSIQVIFCRNVMIYFDLETRTDLVSKFYDLNIEGGYLFIGHSETLNFSKTNYKYIMPAVYRK